MTRLREQTDNRDRRLAALAVATVAFLAAAAADSISARLERVRAMSPENRLALTKSLERFDRLPSATRERVIELDRALSTLPPEEMARYLETLRRYHVWLRTLPEAQRNELENAAPEQKPAIVARLQEAQSARRRMSQSGKIELKGPAAKLQLGSIDRADLIQLSSLAPVLLEDAAGWLKIWYALEPRERQELESIRNPDQVQRQIRQKLKGRPDLIAQLDELGREFGNTRAWLRRLTEMAKTKERTRAYAQEKLLRLREADKIWSHADEFVSVTASNLALFEDTMPRWIRESIDALPPEGANRRLSVLYRLVFPAPGEIPQPEPVVPKSKSGAGRPAGSSKDAGAKPL
jgi:hypothetical protein